MGRTGPRGPKQPAQTRQQIVEATAALHEEVGPAATTVTAIAERAGVQRLTVYRHFPDERAVIGACAAHWRSSHPLPDEAEWAGEPDVAVRLERALTAVFEYYERGAPMLGQVLRDEGKVPALAEEMAPYHAWFAELRGQLSAGWGVGAAGQRQVRALVGHALSFETWRSLTAEGLGSAEAAHLLAAAITRLVLPPA